MLRILFVFITLSASASAAPPVVTSLFPAGGERGTSVLMTATGSFDTWPVQTWCNSPGIVVKAEKTKGQFAVILAKDVPLGVHWLRFHDETGASSLRPFIVGDRPEVAETEPNDDLKTAPIVVLPAVVNGVLAKSGDVDAYRVKLIKGQTLVASLEAHRTLRSPMDAILQLVSDTGAVVTQNHDTRGLDPELAFTAPADGTYAVRLFAFPSQPDSSIRHFGSPACIYRLTLTTGEFVDFARPLAAEKNREVSLTLHGWNLKDKSVKLGKSEDRFGITREPHLCVNGTTDKPLSAPFTITGCVEKAGQPSVVLVAGVAGKALAIHLDPAGLSLNPILRIADGADKQLAKAEPAELNGPIVTSFKPPTTANYRLEVRDLFTGSGPRHVYRLRVTPALPDIEAKVASDRFVIAIGTPLDIPISIKRLHGHQGELIPFADRLPDGVVVESAPPATKPPADTVTLRLKSTKAFQSGPIRIGVSKKGDDTIRNYASAALVEYDRSTEDIWLSGVPEKR
jgi:hypothetical protein